MKTLGQYYEFLFSKIEKVIIERTYIGDGGGRLKYILKHYKQSKRVIIVLSACTRKGIKARYNYMRTLSDIPENQLYILDDFGYDRRGAYYLGFDCGNEIERSCISLIKQVIKDCDIEQIIFCGSSKGGWAALNLMTAFNKSIAIVGAPQYYLANYLMSLPDETTKRYILPTPSADKITFLNDYLKNKLISCAGKEHVIYLHYSDIEHTYEEHIKFFLEDAALLKYNLYTECLHYTEHWDVGRYFSVYLKNVLNSLDRK